MASEHLPNESEYVMELIFGEIADYFFNFVNVLFFHSDSPFIRGKTFVHRG
jgi:hypothetical protein